MIAAPNHKSKNKVFALSLLLLAVIAPHWSVGGEHGFGFVAAVQTVSNK